MATIHSLPDTPEDHAGLTLRQRRVLEVIRESVEGRGYPPSVREIGEAVGLNSPSSVAHQLKVLEAKGYLRRDPNRPRAMEVLDPEGLTASTRPTAVTQLPSQSWCPWWARSRPVAHPGRAGGGDGVPAPPRAGGRR